MEESRIGRIAGVRRGVIRALDRVRSSDIDWQYPYPLDSDNSNMLRRLHPIERSCSRPKRKRAAPYATSLMDYLFRWMELKFLTKEQGKLFESRPVSVPATPRLNGKGAVEALGEFVQFGEAPVCNICGSLMVRSGTCYRCMTCGSTSGCS